ncbi:hypothetical protein BDV12DRAFT_77542 [Aspergillus spectabilis]
MGLDVASVFSPSKTFRCPPLETFACTHCVRHLLRTPLRFRPLSFAITFHLVEPSLFFVSTMIYTIFTLSCRSLTLLAHGTESILYGKTNMEWGAFFIHCTSLAVHRCLYIFTFASRCFTNFALAYRKRGRMVLLLARMVYPIARPGLHNPRITHGYGGLLHRFTSGITGQSTKLGEREIR